MDFPFELTGDRIRVEARVKGAVRSGILDTSADGTAIDRSLCEVCGKEFPEQDVFWADGPIT